MALGNEKKQMPGDALAEAWKKHNEEFGSKYIAGFDPVDGEKGDSKFTVLGRTFISGTGGLHEDGHWEKLWESPESFGLVSPPIVPKSWPKAWAPEGVQISPENYSFPLLFNHPDAPLPKGDVEETPKRSKGQAVLGFFKRLWKNFLGRGRDSGIVSQEIKPVTVSTAIEQHGGRSYGKTYKAKIHSLLSSKFSIKYQEIIFLKALFLLPENPDPDKFFITSPIIKDFPEEIYDLVIYQEQRDKPYITIAKIKYQ